MKHTKLLLLLVFLSWLSSGLAYAQTNRLYIPELKMSRGSEATLSVYMDNVDEVTAVEFTLEMPSGFTANPLSAKLTERAKSHTITARKLNNGKYKFVVLSETNAPIDGISGQLFTFRVTSPNNATDENDYPIMISSAVMSAKSGANVLQETEDGKISIKSLPDLHVVSVECSDPVAGSEMTVKWKVRNDGRGSTENYQWKDYIWLVANVTFGTAGGYGYNPILLATVDNMSALDPSESYENQAIVKLEERIYGNYDILVTSDMPHVTNIDFSSVNGTPPYPYQPEVSSYGFFHGELNYSTDQVLEEGEENGKSDNFFYKQINIAVPPLADLQVTNIAAYVIPTTDPEVGFAASRKKTGYIITEPLDPPTEDELLMPWYEAYIPNALSAANLRYSNAFYSGKKIKVKVTVANKGGKDTEKGFKTTLYISSSADRDAAPLYGVDTKTYSEKITIGNETILTFAFYLPYEWSGDTYFHAYADIDDEVYELTNTLNNWGCSPVIDVSLTPGADFSPKAINVPSIITTGSSFSIDYDVQNIGAGVPYHNSWTDKVFISKSNSGINQNAIELGSFKQEGRFAGKATMSNPHGAGNIPRGAYVLVKPEELTYSGDSYSASHDLKVNNLSLGTYYFYVKIDAENDIFELNGEDNNVICSGPVQIVAPDLTTELLSISEETLTTGQTVSFSWKLKNVGNGNIQNVTVNDAIYACNDANGSNMIMIGEVKNPISIVSGGEKTLRANVKIPDNTELNGMKYIFVKTDANNLIAESSESNNLSNTIQCEFKYVSSDQPAANSPVKGMNISVYSLSAPNRVTPGQQVEISYTIENTGDLAIDKDITHEVFISDNRSLNISTATACLVDNSPNSVIGMTPSMSRTVTLHITIPDNIKGGSKFLHVILNRNNQLNEKKKDDNAVFASIFINGNLPDFSISDLQVPTTIMTAQSIVIGWTLNNTGNWNAPQVPCNIYLSENDILDSRDKVLATVISPNMDKGSCAAMEANVMLDDDVVGNYWLFVMANVENSVEEKNTGNNSASKAIFSKQSLLPDLAISDFTVEGDFSPGSVVTAKAKIQNVGDSITRKDKWSDAFYLSTDYSLNTGTAIHIGSKTHVGKVDKDGAYELTTSLTIPTDIHGYYFLYAKTDGGNAIIEKNKDNNIVKSIVYVEDGSNSPSDLVVKSISAPSSITAGVPVTISYVLSNQGQFAAKGNLRELIYLSKDQQWDEDDQMVGVVSSTINLPAGNEEIRQVTGRIMNVVEGSYYLIVRTNSTHSIVETDYANNMTVAKSATSIGFSVLSIGSSTSVNTSGYYKLPISAGFVGKTISLKLSHSTTIPAGLYAAYGQVPSTAHYDRSSNIIQANKQEVLIPNVQEGNYYILAQDNSSAELNLNEFILNGGNSLDGTTMDLSALEVDFGATSLSINEGGTNGWITTELHGALLDSIMDFRLARDNKVIPVEVMTFYDQTSAKTTFNLNKAETGLYDIVSELPDGSQATMKDAFRVIPGVNVSLSAKIDAPHWTHLNNIVPVTITYANGGNTDNVIYELLVTTDGGDLSETIEGFKNPQQMLHLRPEGSVDSRGYITISPGTQKSINCFFKQYKTGLCHLNLYIIK